jgi:hypothetical protein
MTLIFVQPLPGCCAPAKTKHAASHIKWLPIALAALFSAYQYFTSEKFVNPETGRASHVGMSVEVFLS